MFTAAFKNLFDWVSRIDRSMFGNKPVLVLSTSNGARGGASVLDVAKSTLPWFGADLRGALAIPKFGDVFDIENGVITEADLSTQLRENVSLLISA